MPKLKSISEAIHQVGQYIHDRMTGEITSLRTGYKKLDGCMIDGIEWGSTVTIGGRPSVGKSAFSDCIVEGCLANNNVDDFHLLDFNWELSSQVFLLRRLSAKFRQTYKYILSADGNTLKPEEFDILMNLLHEHYGHLPITFCEEPLSAKEFGKTIRDFIQQVGKKVLVRVDHTLLAKQISSESSQVQMLHNLLGEANEIKREGNSAYLFLTQLGRELEERQEDGSVKSFPLQRDVYGGDATSMFSETILLLNKPSKYGVTYYGARGKGKVVNDDDLFVHAVKNRNATPDLILHFKENFKNMNITEYD